jgi:hypothetical protein
MEVKQEKRRNIESSEGDGDEDFVFSYFNALRFNSRRGSQLRNQSHPC